MSGLFLLNSMNSDLFKSLFMIFHCVNFLIIVQDEKKIKMYFDNLYISMIFYIMFIVLFFSFLGFGPVVNLFSFSLYICPFFWLFTFAHSLKMIFLNSLNFNFSTLSTMFLELISSMSRVFSLTIRLSVNLLIGKSMIEFMNLIENMSVYLMLNFIFIPLELIVISFQCIIFSYFICSFLSFD